MRQSNPSELQIRVLERLAKQIAEATDARVRWILTAKYACALARLSRTDVARAKIQHLRAVNVNYDAELTGWILLAEGLVEHFDSLAISAVDKFRRASAIGVASGNRELGANASAWLANAAFIQGNHTAAATHLTSALSMAEPSDDATLGRASLVVADLLSWAGARDAAKAWYRRARSYAIADGDIAMQSVVLFNSAAFSVAEAVHADCSSAASTKEVAAAAAALDSITNLDRGLGIESLSSMVPLLRAELLTVQRAWSQASALFEGHFAAATAQGQQRLVPKLQAQHAYSLAQLGDFSRSASSIDLALLNVSMCTDSDDLFVLHARAASTFQLLGEQQLATSQTRLAKAYRDQFISQQRRIADEVSALLSSSGVSQRKDPA